VGLGSSLRATTIGETNKAQIELWNGRVGEKWAALQLSVGAMLAQATAELAARVGPVAGHRVLDIGCGAGETCAIWLAGGATVTGIDVSGPMLAVAAERTQGKARLLQTDASTWRSDKPFDLAVSQFGLMFFANPDEAFATIAANLRPGGRLLFSCWRSEPENQWVTTSMDAIRPLLPAAPPPVPHAPGPFALADSARLRGILERAGFADITISPFDFPVRLATGGGVDAAVRMAMQIGPTGSALTEASKETRVLAAERLAAVLAPFNKDGVVELGGALWMVEAIATGPAPIRRA
jgi:SAM-dependent methyltransferase